MIGNIYKIMGLLSAAFFSAAAAIGETFSVKSPDGKLEAVLNDGDQITFSLMADGKEILKDAPIGMDTDKGKIGSGAKAKGSSLTSHSGTIENNLGLRKTIKDEYNQLEVDFGGYKVILRAYNEAAAYRFVSNFGDGEMLVFSETLKLPLPDSTKTVAHVVQGMATSFERLYKHQELGELKKQPNASLPFIFEKNGFKVAIVESSWFEYPGLRIGYPKDASSAQAMFAKYPKKFKLVHNLLQPEETENYIAKTEASREFPWRAFIVARKDIELADNDTIYKLARPCQIEDTSWISAGPSVWDWWVNWTTEGVDFPCAFNDDMCKYYIDFAAENDIPVVTFDAGWHFDRSIGLKNKSGLNQYINDEKYFDGKPYVNIPAHVKYAHSKGVKVFIWVLSKALYAYPEKGLDLFKEWGVDGLKIDFTDRDDQLAIRHFVNITKMAAERNIMIDWHGCPSMVGLNRTYPNAVNFEGVYGGEVNKWSKDISPAHNVDLIYTRMLLGPMDYTPGGMRNSTKKDFAISNNQPCVQGTRAHMVAMYVIYNAPLQMMSDRPCDYEKYPDILKFIATTPTTWDDSKAIEGKLGEYAVIARRKGDVWYIAGMADWNGKKVSIDLSKILDAGDYEAEIIRDSINSNIVASDYKRETKTVSSSDILDLEMKNGGGFAVKLTPKKFLWLF